MTKAITLEEARQRAIKSIEDARNRPIEADCPKLDIDDLIEQFIEGLDFDTFLIWANFMEVSIEYPPMDDMYPDWENEIRTEVAEEMRKVMTK